MPRPRYRLCLLGFAALAAVAVGPRRAEAGPPNVVLIISDDQGWGDYGFMGHPLARTPHLDRLAGESLLFTRGYVPSSLCSPSLTSILTGRYPHEHGITGNDPARPSRGTAGAQSTAARAAMARAIEAVPTLPRLLAGRGYVSLQTGKWWLGHWRSGGFTAGMSSGDPDQGGRHGDRGLSIGRQGLAPIFDFIASARAAGKPFFVWYAPMLPHTPHDPPERLLAKYPESLPLSVRRYLAMVEWFDETCGALLAHLDEQGLARDTIVAYVADNGWIQSERATKYAPRSKQSPYDGGLRTPVLLRWPGRVTPRRVTVPVSSLDLAPTISTAAGLAPPPGMSGVNLLDERAWRARRRIFGACFTHDVLDLARPGRSLRWRWIIEDRWKLIVPAPQNQPHDAHELFDLEADPHELQNRAPTEPRAVARLKARLDAWWPGRP
jgi:uncharacterized sulfatase